MKNPPAAVVHPELQAFLDRHRAETPTHSRAAHDALLPMMRLVQRASAHVNELLSQLEEAEMAAHADVFDHNMRWLHDQASTVKHRGELARAALRDFAHVYAEFAKVLTRPETAILRDMGVHVPLEQAAKDNGDAT